ncbi:multicopper oxidase [Backusella circina FSU 941]|nr:multicopper oxidase [Backusella circina FSU 941]
MIISTSVFLFTLLISHPVHSALRHYDFTLTESPFNPDCHLEGNSSPLINGQFPGPAIQANQGDDVEVLIKNQLPYNASIHFHGIRQIGTVESDGVPGVTQNPIAPGATFLHRFRLVDQAGTYFYHAHVGLQDDSVQGPLVVYESKEANPREKSGKTLAAGPHIYDDELVLHLSEWWHEKLNKREQYYLGPEFAFDKGADSILFNGMTIHDQDAPGLSEENCKGYASLNVNPNTRYRLRVIGGNTFRTLGLAIKDHVLTVMEVDGELVKPYNVSYLEITPGQRFSVLLTTGDHQPDSTFAIATNYLWRQRGRGYTKNGYGYLRYKKPDWVEEDNLFQLFPDAPVQPPREEEEPGPWKKHSENNIEVHGGKGDSDEQNVAEFYKDDDEEEDEDYDDDDDDNDDDDCDYEEEDHDHDYEHDWDDYDDDEEDDDHWDDDYDDDKDGEGDGWVHWRDDDDDDRESDINYAHMHGADFIFRPKNSGNPTPGGGGGQRGGSNDKPVAIFDKLPEFPAQELKNWYWHNLVPVRKREPIVDLKDVKTIQLKSTMKKMNDNTTRYFINDREPHMRDTCALDEVRKHSYKQIFTIDSDYNTAIDAYSIGYNETVDLVFQNSIHDGGCLLHPWHTHGHSHYLLAMGEGEYNHNEHKNLRNFSEPLYKDVSVVYPSHPLENQEGQGCGWTKVRIFTNNPGMWAIHCHITTHMLMGKMIVLEEASDLIEKHKLYNN